MCYICNCRHSFFQTVSHSHLHKPHVLLIYPTASASAWPKGPKDTGGTMAESIGTSAKCQRSKRLPRDLNVSGLLVYFNW